MSSTDPADSPNRNRERDEAKWTFQRLVELRRDPVSGDFQSTHLREINRRIFQDLPGLGYSDVTPGVYRDPVSGGDWIKSRVLESTSERSLVAYSRMDPAAQDRIDSVLAATAQPDKLSKLKPAEFTQTIADLYVQLDHAHPFSDGNSRTLREFTRQLSHAAGYELDWERFNRSAAGRDTLYIARDLSVNALAIPQVTTEGTMRRLAHSRHIFHQNRDLPDLIKDAIRPLRSVAFERLSEDEAIDRHPELRSLYDGLRNFEKLVFARFPNDEISREKYLVAAKSDVIQRLNAGEILAAKDINAERVSAQHPAPKKGPPELPDPER